MPSSSDHSSTSITGRSFAVRRKGFDPDEVRAYLGQLAEVVSRLTTERDGARGEAAALQAAAEARPEIDEDQLTEVLGEETARVLSSARRAATEIKDRAEETAARMRREAVEEAGETRRTAEEEAAQVRDEAATVRLEADEARRLSAETSEADAARVRTDAEADAAEARAAAEDEHRAAVTAAAALRAEAETEAEATRAAAEAVLGERTAEAEVAAAAREEQGRAEADAIQERAEAEAASIRAAAEVDREALQEEGREMVAEAKRVRQRMLADLSRRRKAARVQLEQLQAGRDRLLESYEAVQQEVDAATSGLRTALPEARRAAESARLRAEAEPADTVDQLEAQITAARSAGLPLVAPEADGDTDAVDDDEADTGPVDITDEADAGSVDITDGGVGLNDPAVATIPLDGDATVAGVGDGPGDPALTASDDEPLAEGEGEEVDELFARLRASREAPVDEAREVLAAGSDEAGPAEETGSEGVGDARRDDAEVETMTIVEAAAPEAAADPGGAIADGGPTPGPDGAPVGDDQAPVAGPTDGDEVATSDGDATLVDLLERRDGAVEPIETRVARRLKRVLADEQGRVLDGVRRAKRSPALDDVLPLEDQVAAYAEAAREDLVAAAEEGAAFEGASLPASTSVVAVADELGRSLAGVVRPRIERCFAAGEDPDDTSDRLRATYREWKTDSLVEATRHHVLAAFGLGQGAVRPSGAAVRWIPDPTTTACPDCEDDALAGAVPSGDAFPTGHAHPPAHPGCRCLVITERVGAPA